MELFADSHQRRAERVFNVFFPTSSFVTPKPNEFLCDPVFSTDFETTILNAFNDAP